MIVRIKAVIINIHVRNFTSCYKKQQIMITSLKISNTFSESKSRSELILILKYFLPLLLKRRTRSNEK